MAWDERGWAARLHELWSSVAVITARDELAGLVLPPIMGLPGVLAVWGLRISGEQIIAYRWRGLALEGETRAVVRALSTLGDDEAVIIETGAAGAASPGVAATALAALRAQGVARVVVAGFTVPGEPAGMFLIPLTDEADPELVTHCLWQVIDVTREAVRRIGARREDEEQQVRDALLAEASLQMDAVLDTTQTMQRVARMAVPAIAEGCLVYVCEDGDKPSLRSSVHVDMRRLNAMLEDPGNVDCLAKLAGAAIAGRQQRVRNDGVPVGTRTIDAQVLRARGRVIGVLLFLFDRGDDRIPHASFLRDLAVRAALAIDNGELYDKRRREVVALQQHLLPNRLPTTERVTLAASYTVGDKVLEVGGDFYDAVGRRDGVIAAFIGDVCGRGVQAAALTGMARHTLGSLLQEGVSPVRALGRLNTGLRRDGSWRFVTAGAALLRPVDDGVKVQWCSAGHPAPIVLRADGSAERGRGGGVPLGVLGEARIGRSRVRLGAGDTLLMFTDGLTETRDGAGRMFEDVALMPALAELRDAPLETLVESLGRAAAVFGGGANDDIAILAVRAEERAVRAEERAVQPDERAVRAEEREERRDA